MDKWERLKQEVRTSAYEASRDGFPQCNSAYCNVLTIMEKVEAEERLEKKKDGKIGLWVEGYFDNDMGMAVNAQFLGYFKGNNLHEAIVAYNNACVKTLEQDPNTSDLIIITDDKRGFFDNEADARKSFG